MSAGRAPVARRAPGKLFVAGEYAVVEPGTPALLVAVDRHLTATVSEPTGDGVLISSDLLPTPTRWHWREDRLEPAPGEHTERARRELAHATAAVRVVARWLADNGLPAPEFDLAIRSALHQGGVKLGLGSSGAVTVATISAAAAYYGLDPTIEQRYRLALLAAAELDPTGSGADLAAGTWGGWISYRAPDRTAILDLARRRGLAAALQDPWPGFAVRRLPPPQGLALEVGWTGTPASTASLLARLRRRAWSGTASHRRFLETTTDCVQACVEALERGDPTALLDQIRRTRGELARLDEEFGIGIFTPALTALCDIAEAAGGAAKPSGAGGGDCGIALLESEGTGHRRDRAPRAIDQLRQRWTTAGVRPLALSPARNEDEE
ncbi:phosphomevalonate kinase [Kitasatospora sp. NPDC094011]|uniref:phosphomevalonate kinase n=1 Tax=Kitasatospora sp. NPDC094011 TaxID=3364090 RepID=UPI0037F7089B